MCFLTTCHRSVCTDPSSVRGATYRPNPIGPHHKINNRLSSILKHGFDAVLAKVVYRNQLLVELDQSRRNPRCERVLQRQSLHSSHLIRIGRVWRLSRIDNLASVCIPRTDQLAASHPPFVVACYRPLHRRVCRRPLDPFSRTQQLQDLPAVVVDTDTCAELP